MATFQTDPVFLATLARAAKIPDPTPHSVNATLMEKCKKLGEVA
jgi:hypothetical protein